MNPVELLKASVVYLLGESILLNLQGLHRVKSGRSLVLTCTALEGKDIMFSWFKDGRQLKSGNRVVIFATGESSMLSINQASSQDSGTFACLGSNGIAEQRMEQIVSIEGENT